MALQSTASSPSIPSAQMVGNAFVEQYYHILHTSPESVYRFYHDSSVLSRPDAKGVMTSVATMEGINEKILSLNFKDYKAEIKTADAQNSYKEGVTVLVTGCLTGKDNLGRKFAQSFFLAPQDNGYFVLNDVFRYMDDNEPLENHPDNGINDTPTVPSIADPEPSHFPDPPAPDPATSFAKMDENTAEKANELDSEKQLATEKENVVVTQSHANWNDVSVDVEPASLGQDDTPKKSYASIVKVVRGSSGPTKVYVPSNPSKVTPKKTENQAQAVTITVPASEPEPLAQPSNDAPESSNDQEAEGHSIYVRNLPSDVKEEQLEMEFQQFGPIKHGGVQVRYNKQQRYCFGFVEFHSLSSVNSAIQASPLTIGGHKVVIEIKRTTTRVGNGRGRFPSGRTGFRSDSLRNRGNYNVGRVFVRNDGNYGEFSGRGRSSGGRGEGYQQGRGRGRGSRSSAAKQNVNST